MRFLLLGLLMLAPLNSMAATASPALDKDPKMYEGTVVSAKSGTLDMTDNAGKSHSFKIGNEAKITVNGKPGKLSDLQLSMKVRVIVDAADQVASVSTIDMVKRVADNR